MLWRLEAPFGRQRHQSIIVTRIVSESWLARIAFAVTHVGRLSASASAGVVAPVDPLSTRTNETRVLGIVLDHLWAAARDAPAHTPFLACAGALRFPAVAVDAVLGALHGVIAIVRLEMSNEKLVNPQSAKHGLEVPPITAPRVRTVPILAFATPQRKSPSPFTQKSSEGKSCFDRH